MVFRDNIIALYLNHKLNADNLDYFNTRGLINIYGNVKGLIYHLRLVEIFQHFGYTKVDIKMKH